MSSECQISEKEIDNPDLVSFLTDAMLLKLRQKVKNPVSVIDRKS